MQCRSVREKFTYTCLGITEMCSNHTPSFILCFKRNIRKKEDMVNAYFQILLLDFNLTVILFLCMLDV